MGLARLSNQSVQKGEHICERNEEGGGEFNAPDFIKDRYRYRYHLHESSHRSLIICQSWNITHSQGEVSRHSVFICQGYSVKGAELTAHLLAQRCQLFRVHGNKILRFGCIAEP